MDNEIKRFDAKQKKVLIVGVLCVVVIVASLSFGTDKNGCTAEGSTVAALAFFAVIGAIFCSGLFIGRGTYRLIFWPYGPRSNVSKFIGGLFSTFVGLVAAFVALFVLAVTQLGC